ncbi:MAG: hypothetical protein Q8942_20695, partial [Bacillota bacterium]|nr:hypothetical protein [Bacillota bacterium]
INKAIDEEINKEIKEEIDGEIKEEVNGEINTETKEEIIEETNEVIKECINEAIDQAAFTNGRLNGQNILKSSDLNTEMASKLQNRPDFLLKNPGGVCVTINGKNTILSGNKPQYIFIDVFNHVKFDLSKSRGNAVFKLNGEKAAFTDEIRSGDIIEILWEQS